jgi:heme exporter protein D
MDLGTEEVYFHPAAIRIADLTAWSVESTECNDLIKWVNNTATHGKLTLETLQGKANEVKSKYVGAAKGLFQSVTNFIHQVIDGYVVGGFKGAVVAIMRWLDAGSSATDQDGFFVFTNNSEYVPATYIFGALQAIFATVAAIAAAVASIFLGIIGRVMSIVGGVLWSILGSVNYDSTATRAAMVHDDDANVFAAPFVHGKQDDISLPDGNEIRSIVNENGNLATRYVPGGLLLCGQASKYTQRAEFHPWLYYSPLLVQRLVTALCSESQSGITVSSTVSSSAITSSLRAHYTDYTCDEYVNQDSGNGTGSLSDDADLRLRNVIALNLAIWTLYSRAMTITGGSTIHFQNHVGWHMQGGTPVCDNSTSLDSTNDVDMAIVIICFCGRYLLGLSNTPVDLSWEWLTTHARDFSFTVNPADSATGQATANFPISTCLSNSNAGFDVNEIIGNVKFGIYMPRYKASSFWLAVGVTIAAVAIVIAGAVIAKVKIGKAIKMRRASNARKVEQAWEQAKATGDGEAYYRAAKRANLESNIIGGSKYDVNGFWNGDPTSDSTTGTTIPESDVLGESILSKFYPTEASQNDITLSTIVGLIAG